MQMLLGLMMSPSSLNFYVLVLFFLLAVQLYYFSLHCFPDHWFALLLPLMFYWLPLMYFLISVIVFFISSSFLYTLVEFWFSTLFSSPVSTFMTIILNSLSNISNIFHFALFLWLCLVLLFETYSSVSSFCLTLCLFLCIRKVNWVPDPENSGLMKRSCGALSYNIPYSPD